MVNYDIEEELEAANAIKKYKKARRRERRINEREEHHLRNRNARYLNDDKSYSKYGINALEFD